MFTHFKHLAWICRQPAPSRYLVLAALCLIMLGMLSACAPQARPAPPSAGVATPVPVPTAEVEDEAPETGAVDALAGFAPLIAALMSGDDSVLAQYIRFTDMPCTYQQGLGGPPKCADGQSEGDMTSVFPVLGPSGAYFAPDRIENLTLRAADIYAIYRVSEEPPEAGWPMGDYGIIVLDADDLVPAITVYVSDDRIVRITYHMDKPPGQVLQEVAGEVLYRAE